MTRYIDDGGLARKYLSAVEIVRAVGDLAKSRFQETRDLAVKSRGLQDFVSDADVETKELIHRSLSEAFPEDGLTEIRLVFSPVGDELFAARRGFGANVNGWPFTTTPGERVFQGLVCVGYHRIVASAPAFNEQLTG